MDQPHDEPDGSQPGATAGAPLEPYPLGSKLAATTRMFDSIDSLTCLVEVMGLEPTTSTLRT
jgi:hypothetical protein